ncbi:uncharacterized protein LOC9658999 [Selaginella moellendorffii]|nr:uncharacterized protein LOC9658999 [Selaginella moellendorffii]|eukprot:XP_002978840.2 uncharacterized protein LOC9658999 [Selaginella moellendorffii]
MAVACESNPSCLAAAGNSSSPLPSRRQSLFGWRRWQCKQRKDLGLSLRRSRMGGLCRSGGAEDGDQPYGVPETAVPSQWDVVGLGQAMVDCSAMVGNDALERLQLEKGVRTVIDHEQRGKVLQALDGRSYKVSAGGSLSNTLVALARLGMGRINVAMTGSVGKDPLGDFYRTKLLRANVHFLSSPMVRGTTGTVIVLTTPDAQRTMLSYQGMSSVIEYDQVLAKALSASRLLVVEGYLWEIPQTIQALSRACQEARKANVLVALTASDVSCISRHRDQFWDVMESSADVLFANSGEARALCGFGSSTSPSFAAQHLSRYCKLVSVTDGARGSYIALAGSVVYVPPSRRCKPVDTCGAGDAYAAGLLYGLLCNAPNLRGIGSLAAKVAAMVVSQQGARLRHEDANQLAMEFALQQQQQQASPPELKVRNGDLESGTGANF